MRDYKFRGQKIDTKEWIYGSFIQMNSNEHQCFIFPENTPLCIELTDFYTIPILKETVGQYTGQHDKNEKEIYEGDLIFIDDVDGTFTVKWNDYSARLEINGDGITADFDNYYGYECEVVGNIYENKELLEGGAE